MKKYIVHFEFGAVEFVKAKDIFEVEDILLNIGFSSRDVAKCVIEEIDSIVRDDTQII